MIKNVYIGADPELFLEKDGKIVSAEGIIGGTKEKPKSIDFEGHYIQEDNVMVEFNIPPCNKKEHFISSINYVKDYLDVLVKLKGFNLNYSASGELDPTQLTTDQSKVFGCDPDFNVYLKDINEPPKNVGNLRCCGGHIHVGYDNPDQDVSEKLIYAMDITLGLDSILLDSDTKRRTMYGKAGSFRFKDYGIEYRTLSNFWIKNDKTIGWVYDRTLKAIDLVNTGKIDSLIETYSKQVRDIIDYNDVNGSIELLLKIENEVKIKEKK
tara:strand:+ start:18801 stop:19601 length:801 start_codon:yes stop_codon:yes gene_type:complete